MEPQYEVRECPTCRGACEVEGRECRTCHGYGAVRVPKPLPPAPPTPTNSTVTNERQMTEHARRYKMSKWVRNSGDDDD